MGRKKRSRAAKKARLGAEQVSESDVFAKAPHSFVFHRGEVGKYIRSLVKDTRKMLEPFTASRLKVRKSNSLKDFVTVAGPLGVTHMIVFTRSPTHVSMRFIRLPRGPTVSFRVHAYSLCRDVVSAHKKPVAMHLDQHPLLIVNNFNADEKPQRLTQSMFQNLFPAINVSTIKLNTVKRCVLVNFNTAENRVDIRHYAIRTASSGISRPVKKLVQNRALPDLGNYADISDFVLMPGQTSESEFEADPGNEVDLPEHLAAGKSQRVAVRLTELGPRLSLELMKVESAIDSGEVLYHAYIGKSDRRVQKKRARIGATSKVTVGKKPHKAKVTSKFTSKRA